ncbi:MAG: ABC transporter permease subunit [Oscillospiraceae bacterium]
MNKNINDVQIGVSGQMVSTGRKSTGQRVWDKIWRNRYIYLMILPVVIYFVVFKYWPMGWLAIAFKDYKILKGFSGSEWIGLQHFQTLFSNPDFFKLIGNTLLLNIYSLAFCFTSPIIFAILLNEIKNSAFKRVTQTISYLPHFLSTVIMVSMVMTFLSPSLGVLNNIMSSMGLEKINFLSEPQYFRTIMVISGIWQQVGWGSIIYLSALTGIDPSLYEAATVDGASKFKQILHITLPGISTTIIIMLILQIGNLMSVNFEKIYLFQNPLNLSVSETLPTYVYKMGMINSNYGLATAIGLFNSVISLGLVLFANRVSKKFSEVTVM